MAFKYIIVCSLALLIQIATSQVSTGNIFVDNDLYVNSGRLANSGLVGFGSNSLASSGVVGSGSSSSANSGPVRLGSSLANSGITGFGSGSLASSGVVGLGSGLTSGGSYVSSGSVGAGSFGDGVVGGLAGYPSGLSVATSPLLVTSVSPISPSGLTVTSDNNLEGILSVNGQLPFLSVVAFEGGLPTAGAGTAACGCGNGDVAIVSEGLVGRL